MMGVCVFFLHPATHYSKLNECYALGMRCFCLHRVYFPSRFLGLFKFYFVACFTALGFIFAHYYHGCTTPERERVVDASIGFTFYLMPLKSSLYLMDVCFCFVTIRWDRGLTVCTPAQDQDVVYKHSNQFSYRVS